MMLLNESYFNDKDLEISVNDLSNNIFSEDKRVYFANDCDNVISFRYEISGIYTIKKLSENLQSWFEYIIKIFDNNIYFNSDFPVLIRMRTDYGINPKDIRFPDMRNKDSFSMFVKNIKDKDALSFFNNLIVECMKLKKYSRTTYFELYKGYNKINYNIKATYNFWKEINTNRIKINNKLHSIIRSDFKFKLDVLSNNIVFYCTMSGNRLTNDFYKFTLSHDNRFSEELIDALLNKKKDNMKYDIPIWFEDMMNNTKNGKSCLNYLLTYGTRIKQCGDVLECTFGEHTVIEPDVLDIIWYYAKKSIENEQYKYLGIKDSIINIPNILLLKHNLKERKYGKLWWTKCCSSITVSKIIAISTNEDDLQRVLLTMYVDVVDISYLSKINEQYKINMKFNTSKWKKKTEVVCKGFDVSYDGNKVILTRLSD